MLSSNLVELKENSGRSQKIIKILRLIILLELLMIIVSVISILELSKQPGETIREYVDFSNWEIIETAFLFLYLAIYLIATIRYIKWFRRAYYNLHVINKNVKYTEKWAVLGWFIPIFNYIIPYQIMKEIYVKTSEYLDLKDREFLRFVKIWWAGFVLLGLFSWLSFFFNSNTLTHHDHIVNGYIQILFSIVNIPFALIAIKVIQDYMELELRMYFQYKIDQIK